MWISSDYFTHMPHDTADRLKYLNTLLEKEARSEACTAYIHGGMGSEILRNPHEEFCLTHRALHDDFLLVSVRHGDHYQALWIGATGYVLLDTSKGRPLHLGFLGSVSKDGGYVGAMGEVMKRLMEVWEAIP